MKTADTDLNWYFYHTGHFIFFSVGRFNMIVCFFVSKSQLSGTVPMQFLK